ncbi:MAG: RedB protein [Candidatus Hydrogenedentes bacterium]|nr:RedB protein [Candidatus Hydrogenedentota bacterium]
MHYPFRFNTRIPAGALACQSAGTLHRTPGKALFLLWTLLLAAGACALSRYEFNGTMTTGVAEHWPDNSVVQLDSERPTLVMFLHPRCPCSAASITQLDRVLRRSPGRFRTWVLLVRPAGVPETWEAGANAEAALRLPETTLLIDSAGELARQFGARYSGTVQAFDTGGNRRFTGGITASRGHEGESLGGLALRDIGAGRVPDAASMPVFGCSLMGIDQDQGAKT